MSLVAVPARLGPLETLSAAEECGSVARALRATAIAVDDVCAWSRSHGSPAGWKGRAADAAERARSTFASSTDDVVAALERATAACDAYADQVADLHRQHRALCGDRATLNRAIDALAAEAAAADASRVSELRSRADVLDAQSDGLRHRVGAFWERVRTAEEELVTALRSVDSVAEGGRAAGSPGRVDSAPLRRQLTGLAGGAGLVNSWWKGLSRAQQEALKVSDPDLLGRTDGIPAVDRDESNRACLERDLARLEGSAPGDLDDRQRALLDRARAAHQALGIPAAGGDADLEVRLLVYRPEAFGGDGAVAVGYGDPDSVDHTAIIVPGMTNDATTIAGQGLDAFTLHRRAVRTGETAAVIAWMGYDAPSWNPEDGLDWPGEALDVGSVVREDRAQAGGLLLADFVDGLRASDEGERSHLSVIGHSYGSTTAANAAHDHGLDAHSLTLLGSPGAGGGVDVADDLAMPMGQVYVGSADNDFVTWLGRDGDLGMGRDPAQADFGATRFGVAHGEEFHADSITRGIANHTSYFDPESNTQSLDNLATIVTGGEPSVVEGRTRAAGALATEWARAELSSLVATEVATSIRETRDVLADVSRWWS